MRAESAEASIRGASCGLDSTEVLVQAGAVNGPEIRWECSCTISPSPGSLSASESAGGGAVREAPPLATSGLGSDDGRRVIFRFYSRGLTGREASRARRAQAHDQARDFFHEARSLLEDRPRPPECLGRDRVVRRPEPSARLRSGSFRDGHCRGGHPGRYSVYGVEPASPLSTLPLATTTSSVGGRSGARGGPVPRRGRRGGDAGAVRRLHVVAPRRALLCSRVNPRHVPLGFRTR